MTNTRLIAALTMVVSGAASSLHAGDVSVGDVFLCHPNNGRPSVELIIGKLETMGEVFGADDMEPEIAEIELMHVQLRGVGDQPLPEVGHSPFGLEALQMCDKRKLRRGERTFGDFDGGYAMWKEAALTRGAGFFTINPADAYWQMLGSVGQ